MKNPAPVKERGVEQPKETNSSADGGVTRDPNRPSLPRPWSWVWEPAAKVPDFAPNVKDGLPGWIHGRAGVLDTM